MADFQRYFTYGLKPAGPASQAVHETKRTMFDAIQSAKIAAEDSVKSLARATEK